MESSTATQPDNGPGSDDLLAHLADYEQRSLAHDAGELHRQDKTSNWSGVGFRIRDQLLAFRTDRIEEIISPPAYTAIPGTRDWLLGIANIRGNLAAISDLGWYLFGEPSPVTARSRLILTRFQSRLAGLLVDEVMGQRHFHADDLHDDDQWNETPFAGLVDHSYPVGDAVWGVLDLEQLEERADFMNGSRDDG
ncbi:MAG TPA: chemotaxis protein CheW [Wenzhouxiangella sp.]|nr:chemotaxis protein CheW [Wenzhouxiangella sp.]